MQLSNEYCAGFFDGEGCVQPMKYLSKTHNEKFIVGMRAVVVQKEPKVLYLLQNQFGGAVSVRKNGIGCWQCGDADQALAFFKAIQPYLIVKFNEVGFAIELLSHIMQSRGTNFVKDSQGRKMLKGKLPIDMEEIRYRQRIEMLLKFEKADPKTVPIT